jgi:serine/threonine protein kinase
MIAGVSPFRASTSADTVAALIERDPQKVSELRSDIPPEIDRIAEKALAKDRSDRYQTAADLIIDLRALPRQNDFVPHATDDNTRLFPPSDANVGLTRGPTVMTTVLETVGSPRLLLVTVLALALLAASGFGYWYFGNSAGRRQIESIAVMPFANESGNPEVDYSR